MVLSLNITRIALHVLRDGLLNKHVALEEDVWATFNFYYACLLYHVYYTWRSQRLSIRDCGPLLQQTETLARCVQIVQLETMQYSPNHVCVPGPRSGALSHNSRGSCLATTAWPPSRPPGSR